MERKVDIQLVISEIQKVFRSYGYKAENPQIDDDTQSVRLHFDTETATGQAAFQQRDVTLSASIGVEEDADFETVILVDFKISYTNHTGGSNGYSKYYIMLFGGFRRKMEHIATVEDRAYNKIDAAMYRVNKNAVEKGE